MSIDYTPYTMMGWHIDDDEDERLMELYDEGCEELDDLARGMAKRLGFKCLGGLDLMVQRDCIGCCDGWVVGIPLDVEDVLAMTDANKAEIEPCAIEVWRAVYGSEPPEPPALIDFVQVW